MAAAAVIWMWDDRKKRTQAIAAALFLVVGCYLPYMPVWLHWRGLGEDELALRPGVGNAGDPRAGEAFGHVERHRTPPAPEVHHVHPVGEARPVGRQVEHVALGIVERRQRLRAGVNPDAAGAAAASRRTDVRMRDVVEAAELQDG